MALAPVAPTLMIGCPADCGRWPACEHGMPREAPPAYRDAEALHGFARDLVRSVEAMEDLPIARGRVLHILVEQIRACEDRLRRLRTYAVQQQLETHPSELIEGYVPLPVPGTRRRGGVER